MSDALTYLMGNRWTKDADGEFITVEDSHAVPPVSLSVDGKSEQVTTTGKNLFDKSKAVSGYLRPDGTVAVSSTTYHSAKIPVAGLSQVTCNGLATANSVGAIIFYDENNEIVQAIAGANGKSTRTEAVPETATGALISFTYSLIDTVQFEAGSTATTYEPYTGGAASPRPDWPQEISSIDTLTVYDAGKNLCPTADGSTIASDWVREGQNCTKFIGLTVENATLTLSCTMNGVPSTTGSNNRLYVTIPGAQSKFCDLNTAGAKSVSVTGSGIVRLGINHNSVDSFGADTLLKDIQLEIGSTATEYEPYTGHTVPDLLPDGYSLRSLPDGTRDELHLTYLRPSDRPGWAWYDRKLVQRVYEATIDESGTWYRNSNTEISDGTWRFEVDVRTQGQPASTWSTANYAVPAYCDHLAAMSTGSLYSSGTNHFGMYQYRLYVRMSGITTLAELTEWLAENPLTVQYPVTPTTITLDPIELPTMQSGLTNIWSDPSTNLSITYERDRNIVITNLKAAIDDLATS